MHPAAATYLLACLLTFDLCFSAVIPGVPDHLNGTFDSPDAFSVTMLCGSVV